VLLTLTLTPPHPANPCQEIARQQLIPATLILILLADIDQQLPGRAQAGLRD
jgi:hypothetical protein